VLRGNLASAPFEQVLRHLAEGGAVGCLRLTGPLDEVGVVHVGEGLVHAISMSGAADHVGRRLVSAGALTVDQLAEAERARAGEASEWLLSELLVHLGHVDEEQVAAVIHERALDAACRIAEWTSGPWHFRRRQRGRQLLPEPLNAVGLLALVADRRREQTELWQALGGNGVPSLTSAPAAGKPLGHDGAALLASVDGVRSVTGLATACGMTLLEALRLLHASSQSGSIVLAPGEPEPLARPPSGGAVELHELVHDGSGTSSAPMGLRDDGQPPADDLVVASLARVMQALSTLWAAPGPEDVVTAPESAPVQALLEESAAPQPMPELPQGMTRLPQGVDGDSLGALRELAELSNSSSTGAATRPSGGPPAAELDAVQPSAAVSRLALPVGRGPNGADTAALLRELSSLGVDQDLGPRLAMPRQAPAAADPNRGGRRRGRFGR